MVKNVQKIMVKKVVDNNTKVKLSYKKYINFFYILNKY